MRDILVPLIAIIFFLALGFFLQRYVKRWTHFERRKTIDIFEKFTKDRKQAEKIYKFYRVVAAFLIIAMYFILSSIFVD